MLDSLTRRTFMKGAMAVAGTMAFAQVSSAQKKRSIKKTLKLGMIASKDNEKKPYSIQDRLQIAKDAGFDAVEPDTVFAADEFESLVNASQKVGMPLDAIICSTHWSSPLSDPDPAVVEKCMNGMRVSLKNAKDMGGDMVLLVPAVVTPQVRYQEAYERSLKHVKELAKEAEAIGITIGLENVWNKFLLSPLEFKAYIEEVNSPRVRAWFDVGNILFYGYPQDWIRTLGKLIARVDIKDFKAGNGTFEFSELLKGNVPFPDVMKALDEIGYDGYFAAEVQGGDKDYLTEAVSKPMDQIMAM